MTALLTLDRVSLAAPDGRLLFSDLTLAVGRERLGVIGRNGSGKSSLLRAIGGTAPVLRGNISVPGPVGVLQQSPSPGGTVAEQLGVAEQLALLEKIGRGDAAPTELDAADWLLPDRVQAALAKTGIDHLDYGRSSESLSGGERMRLGLARLLIDNPDLILLDEPTNDLDESGRDIVLDFIAAWSGAVVIATTAGFWSTSTGSSNSRRCGSGSSVVDGANSWLLATQNSNA